MGDRDLYGELAKAAHDDGLTVFARMDSNRTHEAFYKAHPDWFARDASGKPYRAGELYVTCVNSPYYEEYIPGILAEIIERTHPEGITDNSWSGLGRDSICYCENCAKKFHERTGKTIPREKNWDDPVYREWIEWNYARRLEIWDLNNRATKAAGGPDCLWVGMNSGSISGQCRSFRNLKEICRRAEIIMLDHQARSESSGFQQNGETGKLIHGLLGWDKLIPESMAMYQAGPADLPQGEQAGARGPAVDARRVCGHDPAVVAPHRRHQRRSPPVPHRRTDQPLARGQSRVPGQPRAGRQRWLGLVAAEHRLLRPRQCRGTRGTAVPRDGQRPGACTHPLSSGSCRPHRPRRPEALGLGPAKLGGDDGEPVRGRAAIRRARRQPDRHGQSQASTARGANRRPISPWRTFSGPTSRWPAAIRFKST